MKTRHLEEKPCDAKLRIHQLHHAYLQCSTRPSSGKREPTSATLQVPPISPVDSGSRPRPYPPPAPSPCPQRIPRNKQPSPPSARCLPLLLLSRLQSAPPKRPPCFRRRSCPCRLAAARSGLAPGVLYLRRERHRREWGGNQATDTRVITANLPQRRGLGYLFLATSKPGEMCGKVMVATPME